LAVFLQTVFVYRDDDRRGALALAGKEALVAVEQRLARFPYDAR
jgi:hypothetical protein